MKTKQLFISLTLGLGLGLGLTLALLWLLSRGTPSAHADSPHYVAPGGVCGGATPCHATIQKAVDAAIPGDEILVATGVYTGVNVRPRNDITTTGVVTQVVYISKTVTIRGGYTTTNWTTSYPITQPTTLGAREQGRVLYISGDISPTIEGLRITGGDATGREGGGVYIITATATISNNQVFSNTASDGGGLFLVFSDARLSGNTVTSNTTSSGDGGGLYLLASGAILSGNIVISNTAGWDGGGLALHYGATTLSGNTVTSNTAGHGGGGLALIFGAATLSDNTVTSNTAQERGGGLYLAISAATLSGNTVISNTASHGGGLYLGGSATLSGNTVISNTADCGGGLYLGGGSNVLSGNTIQANTAITGGGLYLRYSTATLTNTVVADNQANTAGCGLYIEGSLPRLLHTTIARNSGGGGSGICVTEVGETYSTVALTNTILVSHTVGITVTSGNTAMLEATLWGTDTWANGTDWGGVGAIITGTHNYWGAPAFVDPDTGDYHIGLTSAAIDKGVNAGVTTDIDSEARPDGCFFDIGADEFITGVACKYIYLPAIMRGYR